MTKQENKKIKIYTDGSSLNNPGPGGLGIVLLYEVNGQILKTKKYNEGYKHTTNNRMELLAVIRALDMLNDKAENLPIEIYTDSQYVSNAINKGWIYGWIKKNFKGVKNPDLWKELIEKMSKFKNIKFIWVKGHNNNHYNEICDNLARLAASSNPGNTDEGYESNAVKT